MADENVEGDPQPDRDETETPPEKGGKPEVKFTPEQQAELDHIIGERLGRQETTLRAKWEAEQAEAKKQADSAAEAARLKEQAEWQKLAEKREAEAQAAQAERDELTAELNDVRIRHAVEIEAARLSFQNPADAYNLADLSGVAIDEGKVVGADKALAALAKDKPYLLRKETGGYGTPRPQQRQPSEVKETTLPRQSKF